MNSRMSAPRKEMPDPHLPEDEFKARFRSQFIDPAFGALSDELNLLAAAAWDAYANARKSPHTRKAGPRFADPDYELSSEWLAAREAVLEAQAAHDDLRSPARFLLINASCRSEHTCPGESSRSYRLLELARRVIEAEPAVAVQLLDLSCLASEYGRHIHPCKGCFSTAAALCHWPCSCYPTYSLGQTQDRMNEIYPMWVAAHGVMIVTPVHWFHGSSPLTLLMDRLVCADGGNPDPTRTHGKDAAAAKRIELAGWEYPRASEGAAVRVRGAWGCRGGRRRPARHLRLARVARIDRGGPCRDPQSLHRLLAALRHEPRRTGCRWAVQGEVRNAACSLLEAVRDLRQGKRSEAGAQLKAPRGK